jgi:hypothetical protein
MATLLKVLNNLADIKSARGVALRVRTQGVSVTGRSAIRKILRCSVIAAIPCAAAPIAHATRDSFTVEISAKRPPAARSAGRRADSR